MAGDNSMNEEEKQECMCKIHVQHQTPLRCLGHGEGCPCSEVKELP